jgi:hypothetical protein
MCRSEDGTCEFRQVTHRIAFSLTLPPRLIASPSHSLIAFLAFFFVAIWHDIEPKLIAWGGLNGLFYAAEIWGKRVGRWPFFSSLSTASRNILDVLCGAFFILVLVSLNLIGYAVGLSGVASLSKQLQSWHGFWVFATAYYFLCWGTRLMFLLQEWGLSQP